MYPAPDSRRTTRPDMLTTVGQKKDALLDAVDGVYKG